MKVLAYLLAFCISVPVLAQDYEFRVLAKIGQTMYKSGSGDWQPLKTGSTLEANDQLKLEQGDYVGLVHNSGLTLELKDPGIHSISSLSNQVTAGKKSLSQKYADYIKEKMADAGPTNRLKATGAVTRAAGKNSIHLIAPSSLEVFNEDHTLIEWEEKDDADTYIVELMNMFDEVVKTIETDDNYVFVNINEALEGQDELTQGYLKVQVRSKSDDYSVSEAVTLKKITNDQLKENISGYIDEVSSQKGDLNALDFYVLANVYEQENLFLDALAAYNRAIDLAPEIAYYKEAKEDFIERWTISD